MIGRGRAIAVWQLKLTGPPAFYTWFFVHLLFLAGFLNRISVLVQWTFAYFTYPPGARLLTAQDAQLADLRTARDESARVSESRLRPTA